MVFGKLISAGQVSDVSAELLLPLAWSVTLTLPRLETCPGQGHQWDPLPHWEHQATLDPPGLFLSSSCCAVLLGHAWCACLTRHLAPEFGKSCMRTHCGVLESSEQVLVINEQQSTVKFGYRFSNNRGMCIHYGMFSAHLLFVNSLVAILKLLWKTSNIISEQYESKWWWALGFNVASLVGKKWETSKEELIACHVFISVSRPWG